MEDEDDDIPLDKPPAPPMSSADYHQLAQKQIMNAVFAALAEAKMEWPTIQPFLDAAREICVADFQENSRVRLHTTRAEGDAWVDAEEAFLGISVADRDSQTSPPRTTTGRRSKPRSPAWSGPSAS
jgi:hypothetical protein